jgi:hypothetical protein
VTESGLTETVEIPHDRMQVYLVPVGPDRYELYTELPDDEPEEAAEPPTGLFKRLMHRFRVMLAAAEQERRRAMHPSHEPRGERRTLARRLRDRSMRWVAEAIAEQRLLWHLRRTDAATLVHPDDVSPETAIKVLRTTLGRDWERHRFWIIIDTLLFIASGLLVLVPGPNVLAYYFAFRMVGHYLSMRGARQGLAGVTWQTDPCEPLSELRHVIALDAPQRQDRVHQVAARLRLEHLASFFERTAVTE